MAQTSFQPLGKAFKLENHFPHSSSDVVLRRKSLSLTPRPTSHSDDRRPTSLAGDRRPVRSRLSATSTITENKRINDSDFDVLPELPPSSATIELDITRSVSSCEDNHQPHANCDQNSIDTTSNTLYISESTLDSKEADTDRCAAKPDDAHRIIRMLNEPLTGADNSNSPASTKYNLYNGDL